MPAIDDVKTEELFVDVPGGHVFVRKWIPDDGAGRAPAVLLHDSLGSVDLWRDFPAALGRALDRPVVAYDRLGFGKSSPREGLPSVDFIAEEATLHFPAVADALGIGRFSLFGHSVGGAMALMVAAAHGPACNWVVTESAQAFVEQRTLAGIVAARERFAQPGGLDRLARWHGDKAQWVLDAWTQVWLSPAFASWSLDPWLGRIECPVLAIHGDLDEFGSVAFPRRIVDGARGRSRLEILRGCGHVPHREQPARVLELTADFAAEAG